MLVTKIKLPLIKFDTQKNKKETNVFFDIENIRGMMVRDWEDKGKPVPEMCVLCKTLKTKVNNQPDLDFDSEVSNYFIIGMSKERLMDKLEKNGLAVLIS